MSRRTLVALLAAASIASIASIAPIALLPGCSSSSGGGTPDAGPTCTFQGAAEEPPPVPAIHTPRWAFEPWISKDISTRDDTYAFVKGFEDRDIPVGVVVIDSPWETNYHTFVPNPSRYPEFPKMVSDLRAKGIRTVLWMTQSVNDSSVDYEEGGDHYDGPSPNYQEGLDCGFYVDDGQDYGWWKGTGAAVDFDNARARAWWHQQQNAVLDTGIAGWKLDFGDSYLTSDPVKTAAGMIPHQTYSEHYYQDFLSYGVKRRGAEEFLTMVRAWDASYGMPGRFFAKKEQAPVVWAGDNFRNWVGLEDALDTILFSAQAGYVVVGSDIGGYLDFDSDTLQKIPQDTLVFARWTAAMGLMPFFQLHGRANLTPWTVADHVDETVAMYRYWAKLHHQLVPFFYSLTEEKYAHGGAIVAPMSAERDAWKHDYRFTVGDAFLVAPLLDATGTREVALPSGATWYDWWKPTADAIAGGQKPSFTAADRIQIPVYVRGGAIVPLDVGDDSTGLGTKAAAGARTIAIWSDTTASNFTLHDEDGATTTIQQSLDAASTGSAKVILSRATRPALVRVRAADRAFTTVTVDGVALAKVADRAALDAATTGWWADTTTRTIWVKLPVGTASRTVVFSP
jgi:alpha-glucosidase (family GH31 glycosyl hydrolase)